MGENSRDFQFSKEGLGLAGISPVCLTCRSRRSVPDHESTIISACPREGLRKDWAKRAWRVEGRGMRMTKALTSIKVYCSQVYSSILHTINQDFPSSQAIFWGRPPLPPGGPAWTKPAAPALGAGQPVHGTFLSYLFITMQ